MLEGMIYGLLALGSSSCSSSPGRQLAAVGGSSQLLTLRVDGITHVSNSGRRQHCKERCRDTTPGRKQLKVCQSKAGNSDVNPHLPIKLHSKGAGRRDRAGSRARKLRNVSQPQLIPGCILFSAPEKNECKDIFI